VPLDFIVSKSRTLLESGLKFFPPAPGRRELDKGSVGDFAAGRPLELTKEKPGQRKRRG
jgi:hypothetical protein